MASARMRLLLGELASARGRWLLLGGAIAAALACVGTVMGARPLIGRSLEAAAALRHGAEATLIIPAGVDDELLARVRGRPGIAAAERRQTVQVRVRSKRGAAATRARPAPGDGPSHPHWFGHGQTRQARPARPASGEDQGWQPVVLFVSDDGAPRIDAFAVERGSWPPAAGAIFVERASPEAAPALGGAEVELLVPGGAPQPVAIAGTVHDPGLAPSWQEHRGYAYTTRETLRRLGAPEVLDELVVRFAPAPWSRREAEAAAVALAQELEASGGCEAGEGREVHKVREVRVPPLGQHPHEGLLFAVQIVLLLFSGLLLILVCVVLATLLAAQLGRKTRELGVLKAIGAGTGQIVALYAAMVALLGAAALGLALPLARWGAQALAARVLAMMNLELAPGPAPAMARTLAILAVAVPLAVTARPIWKAARRSVREALAQHGTSSDFVSPALTRLPLPLRNALRRPARLAYSLGLLAIAGALVLAAANVQRGLSLVAEKVDRARRFDVEIRLHQPAPLPRLGGLAKLPQVVRVEAWAAAPSGLAPDAPGPPELEGQETVTLARTYRDGGHGSAQLLAPPAGSTVSPPPLLRGRWLRQGEDDAVVLSQSHPVAGAVALGERVELVVAGRRTGWRLVGVVEELAGAAAFVTPAAFRRVTGEEGARLLRISTARRPTPADLAALEGALGAAGLAVTYAMPTPELRAIIDDHVALVTRSIVILASLLTLVGFFALGTMTAIGVVERTREIGVLKSLGASSAKLAALFLGEALSIAAGSALLAFALSLPLTELVRLHVALGSLSPEFAVSLAAAAAWLLAVLAGSALAAGLPARRAARLTVREALAEG